MMVERDDEFVDAGNENPLEQACRSPP
eukprot:COSAG06_NODE_41552_length_390_cov_0.745704_1_plen_26_part_01